MNALRISRPRRVSSQILALQLALTAGVTLLAAALFLAPLGEQLDDQAMRRALAIAQTTAAEPEMVDRLASSRPTRDGPVQDEAERIRVATGAEYVVVMDRRGIRWSHTDPARIGERVSTDPSEALAGNEVMQIDRGTLGQTARGKVPLLDADGRIVGAVSVGIAYESVQDRLINSVPGILAYAGGALAAGALAAYAISRRLQRRTRDLAFSDIAGLLDEREAMLHSIREGVVALDKEGRIRLVNDEAGRLLGLGPEHTGRRLEDVLPPGRTTDVLSGRVKGDDLLAVSGARVLVANRMPTSDGGAVATLRDRTELERLGRELDSTHGLIDALRAQDHEHANRMHTLLGLLELGMTDEALDYIAEAVGGHRDTAEQVTARIRDPLLAALLVGKATVAAERGVALRVEGGLPDAVVDPRGLVTIVGNLIDNALDAAVGSLEPAVEVKLTADGRTVVLRVADSGGGVPGEQRELVFSEGWTTKPLPAHGKRGLGLPLVRRLAQRQGGSATVGEGALGGAEFTVVLPEALAADPADGSVVLPEALAADPADGSVVLPEARAKEPGYGHVQLPEAPAAEPADGRTVGGGR